MGAGGKGIPAPKLFSVKLSATAEAVYEDMFGRVEKADARGDHDTAHHTALRMVDEVLDKIIPERAVDRGYGLSGTLANVFRCKKGRMRICWIASSEKREAVVLFISETPRKEGDKHDPYKLFEQLVASGGYDEVFDQLGVRRPKRSASVSFTIQ